MKYTRQELSGKALTVMGLIPVNDLGITLPHEHCLLDARCCLAEPLEMSAGRLFHEPLSFKNVGYVRYGRDNLDNYLLTDEEHAIKELMFYKSAGGTTLADATPVDLARNPQALKRISSATGLNIIMGSGYYVKACQGRYLDDTRTEDSIAEEIVSDILDGVGDSGIHAGIIGEIGCSWPLEPCEKRVLQAAAMAQKETGAPLHVHPGRSEDAPTEIIKILKEVGADLNRTVIDHIDRTVTEPKNRYRLADSGCFLEYDLFGIETYYPETLAVIDVPNDAQRIAQIRDLMSHGYGDQILISQDFDQKYRYKSFGGHGYDHILTNAIPAMRRRGMTDDQIDSLLIDNPKRLFTFT
jgi:phosphotriesterase-related protein